MAWSHLFAAGQGKGGRRSHHPPVGGSQFQVQAKNPPLPHYPFQPLPPPNGSAPFRFDLSALLAADDITAIENAGVLVCHTVGDTGDFRGQQQDFVAAMLTQDAQQLAVGRKNLRRLIDACLADIADTRRERDQHDHIQQHQRRRRGEREQNAAPCRMAQMEQRGVEQRLQQTRDEADQLDRE